MPQFQIGIAYRGSAMPEIKQVVEATSIRQAMLRVSNSYGGDDVVLVTYAHPLPEPSVPGARAADASEGPSEQV
jgi:hypothetical protein